MQLLCKPNTATNRYVEANGDKVKARVQRRSVKFNGPSRTVDNKLESSLYDISGRLGSSAVDLLSIKDGFVSQLLSIAVVEVWQLESVTYLIDSLEHHRPTETDEYQWEGSGMQIAEYVTECVESIGYRQGGFPVVGRINVNRPESV